MIRFDRVSKSFDGGGSWAVIDLTLEIGANETLVLVGSSGSGKTTALKMINRLIEPTSGHIEVDGTPIARHDLLTLRRSMGYVIQKIGLFPHLSVEQNVGMALRIQGWSRQKRRQRVCRVLDIVGLDPERFSARRPGELSGGQQQRVGVARALAADPPYLLMDEPFGALDPVTRESLQQEMLRLKQQIRKTIVFVTHDTFEATLLADRIAVMHQGRLEQLGAPEEIIQAPATGFVRQLFSRVVNRAVLSAGAES